MKKLNYKNTYLIYTAAFLVLLPIVFLPFIQKGKSFVWELDGLDQHLPMLLYYGKLLRGFLLGQGFPMVDLKLGMGFDTITTLSYYVLGDPIALLSVFMTKSNAVVLYDILILLRFYLAGISFILLMKYWKKDGSATAIAALVYIFSGFTLYSCIRHPFFMNPLIYLPLILIGVEQVLRKKKPYLMIIMIFISAVSNFYFFFILTVIMVIYILFRYFTQYRKAYRNIFTGLLLTGVRTGGCYLSGVLAAAFILLPVVYAFTNNGRLNVGPKLLTGYFAYSKEYYVAFVQGFYSIGAYAGYWTILSFPFIVIVSFAVILCNKKYWKIHIIYFLVFLGLFIPAFGYFMNGFSYVINRWGFVLDLLVAVTFRLTYEKIFTLRKREIAVLLAELGLYGIVVFIFPSERTVRLMFYYVAAVILIILILQIIWHKQLRLSARTAFCILAGFSLGLNGVFLYSPLYCNYVSQFETFKTVEKTAYHGVLSTVADLKDDSLYRVESFGDRALNEALIVGCNDVSGYYSLMDGGITDYLKGLEDADQISAYRFDSLDNRTILDALAGVKYLATTNPASVPYGYTLLKQVTSGDKIFYLYHNEYSLPLGYTFDSYILQKDYDRLSALEKQSVMLQSVVLEKNSGFARHNKQRSEYGIRELSKEVIAGPGIKLTDKSIRIIRKEATLTVQFNTLPNSEIYIRLGGLSINKKKSTSYNFYAQNDSGVKKKINLRNIYYNSYFGKKNYLINVGQSLGGKQSVVLTFPERERLSYQSIDVYSVDMNAYKKQVNQRQINAMTDLRLSGNRMEGNITLDSRKVLAIAIPYSKGWSAYVDGKRKELLRGNIMYMALPLEPGKHHIMLKYETPYLKLGILISAVTITALLLILLRNRLAAKKRSQ